MKQIAALQESIRIFASQRDWEQFHTPKNLVMAITGEAGELAAEFQWLSTEEAIDKSRLPIQEVEMEIADVAIYLFRLCDVLDIDLESAIRKKIKINEQRFPIVK